MADVSRRLLRLFDDLEDICDNVGPIGFGVISTEPSACVERQSLWGKVARLVPRGETGPVMLDPYPDGTACVRWLGDGYDIATIQRWAFRAEIALVEHGLFADRTTRIYRPGAPKGECLVVGDPLLATGKSYRLLSHLAMLLKRESSEVVRQTVLDQNGLGSIEKQKELGVPIVDDKLVSFVFMRGPRLEVYAVETFKKLCELGDGPRLTVDKEAMTVKLDGVTYTLEPEFILVLESIVSGGGNPVSRGTMRKRYTLLSDDEHLERRIDALERLCPAVFKLIERVDKKGFLIPKEYLA